MATLTIDKIHTIADKLAKSGVKPTQNEVRKALGGGSFTTISEGLKSWNLAQEENRELASVDIPEELNERLEAAKGALWLAALTRAEMQLQSQREELKELQEQAKADVAEATTAVEILEREADESAIELSTLRLDVEALRENKALVLALKTQLEEVKQELKEAVNAEKEAIAEAAHLKGEIKTLKETR